MTKNEEKMLKQILRNQRNIMITLQANHTGEIVIGSFRNSIEEADKLLK